MKYDTLFELPKEEGMAFYVLREDFNRDELEYFNIFNNYYVSEDIEKYKKEYKKNKDRDELINKLDRTFRYAFWSKCEYEIIVTSLFSNSFDRFEKKVDVYGQIRPNIPIIADMLIHEWEK